jgi:transcriptional regulator with XRE-family HTH domain
MQELYNLPHNLKALRKQYGYSQTYVAEQLGIAYQSYQAYEWGLTVPTLQNFIKLAKLYDVSYEDLLAD